MFRLSYVLANFIDNILQICQKQWLNFFLPQVGRNNVIFIDIYLIEKI
ncbi:Uncharacterised protein [Chlamydia trachomatis]|nr:Uncharacterised protein [Chlamydia trachomatis]